MSRFRREDARSRATMKHTQPDFLCLQLLLFLYLCLVFAAEAVGCRICRANRRPFAKGGIRSRRSFSRASNAFGTPSFLNA